MRDIQAEQFAEYAPRFCDKTMCVLCRWPVNTALSGAVRYGQTWAHDICVDRYRAEQSDGDA
jgi:hypothetical protein